MQAAASIAALLLAGIVATAWLLPPQLEWNRYRADITSLVSTNIGRPVSIDGPISLQLLPQPTITAGQVTVADVQDDASIAVAELRVRLALAPLLAGRVDAREVVLRGLDIRLPWPLHFDTGITRQPDWLSSISARIESGRIAVGAAAATDINATLGLTHDTGTLSLAGTAVISALPWHLSARLARTGQDGSAGLDLALDGQGPVQGLGAMFTGQIAGSGEVAGRFSGSGPDLSRLLAAPAVPFKANGNISVAGGVALADGLSVDLAGSPARGAVTLRLVPQPRLDVSLAASRLDLDAWLPALINTRPGQRITSIETGIDLSAEAATLAGGTLRGLRGGFEITPTRVTLRDVTVILPGDAKLGLVGDLQRATASTAPQFTGRATLAAPSLRTTLSWLDRTSPALLPAIPEAALHQADLSTAITVNGRADSSAPVEVSLSDLTGTIDASHVQGKLTLRPAPRFGITANLHFDHASLDPWFPETTGALTGLPQHLGPFDLDLQLKANEAMLHGHTLTAASLDLGLEAGRLTLRRLETQSEAAKLVASGSITDAGRITDGKIDLTGPADSAARLLTSWWPEQAKHAQRLPFGPLNLSLMAAGPPEALALRAALDLGDLHVDTQPMFDIPGQRWGGKLTLRHPGAPRLLDNMGFGGTASWLGDGSISFAGTINGAGAMLAPTRLSSEAFDITAGSLRAHGSLAYDNNAERSGSKRITGRIIAETLPLPLPYPRTPDQLPITALSEFDASVHVEAGDVLVGLSPALKNVAGQVTLNHGTLAIDDLQAQLEAGKLTGRIALQSAASPPALAAELTLAAAKPANAVFDTPLDISGGDIDATVNLQAEGYSPAALLATLSGQVQLKAAHGALTGIDLAATGPRLAETDMRTALAGGSTPFDRLDVTAALKGGLLRFSSAHFTAPSGTGDLSGLIDLPGQSGELRLVVQPKLADAPTLALRLSGALAKPARTLELSDALRWRAEHPAEAAP